MDFAAATHSTRLREFVACRDYVGGTFLTLNSELQHYRFVGTSFWCDAFLPTHGIKLLRPPQKAAATFAVGVLHFDGRHRTVDRRTDQACTFTPTKLRLRCGRWRSSRPRRVSSCCCWASGC